MYLKNKTSCSNIRGFSRDINVPRSTVKDHIIKLSQYELIIKKGYDLKLTEKGLVTLESEREVGGAARSHGRGTNKRLSIHQRTYLSPITDRSSFNEDKLYTLKPLEVKKINLRNHSQLFLYFHDATIRITPKELKIHVHEIETEDINLNAIRSFDIALKYIESLSNIKLMTEKIYLDNTHFEQVNSAFAEALRKIDDKYFIKLKDGRRLWIDKSPTPDSGNINVETDDEDLSKSVNNLIQDVAKSDHRFKDIDKIVDALNVVARIELLKIKSNVDKAEEIKKLTPLEKPSYFG